MEGENLLQLLAKLVWKEIAKQSVKGSGIHLNFSIHPGGSLCIDGLIFKNGVVFAKAKELHPDWHYFTPKQIDKEIKESVKMIIEICTNTLNATDKELKKYNII